MSVFSNRPRQNDIKTKNLFFCIKSSEIDGTNCYRVQQRLQESSPSAMSFWKQGLHLQDSPWNLNLCILGRNKHVGREQMVSPKIHTNSSFPMPPEYGWDSGAAGLVAAWDCHMLNCSAWFESWLFLHSSILLMHLGRQQMIVQVADSLPLTWQTLMGFWLSALTWHP